MEGADPPQGGGIRVALAKGGGRRDTADPSPAQATEGEPVEEEVDFDFGGDLDEAERDAWDVLVDGHADGDDARRGLVRGRRRRRRRGPNAGLGIQRRQPMHPNRLQPRRPSACTTPTSGGCTA